MPYLYIIAMGAFISFYYKIGRREYSSIIPAVLSSAIAILVLLCLRASIFWNLFFQFALLAAMTLRNLTKKDN